MFVRRDLLALSVPLILTGLVGGCGNALYEDCIEEKHAAIVQANRALFKKSNRDNWAAVVFSPDSSVADEKLLSVASAVYALKGTTPTDPELAHIAARETKEYVSREVLLLPETLSGADRIYLADLLVERRKLPNRRLESRLQIVDVQGCGTELRGVTHVAEVPPGAV